MAAEPPGTVPASESGGMADVEAPGTDPGSVLPPGVEPEPQVDARVTRRPLLSSSPTFSHARLKAIALSRGGANAVLIKGWEEIDDDGDDFMTKDTFQQLTTHLNIQWNVDDAWAQAKTIEEDRAKREKTAEESGGLMRVHQGDDQIHFTSYTSVFNVIMGAERRNHRLVVKLGFEKLVRDRRDDGHGLNKREIGELVASCKRKLLLLSPSFDLETDWKLMQKRTMKLQETKSSIVNRVRSMTGSVRSVTGIVRGSPKSSYKFPEHNGQAEGSPVAAETQAQAPVEDLVDWDAFEEWWKFRMGLTETNVPVIPEYFSYKLKELGPRKTSPDSKNQLWWELQRRIQLMVKMRKDWGHLQSTYGHTESTFGTVPVIGWVIDPESSFSTRWDMLQVIFLFYVTIFVPLRACFQTDVEIWSAMWYLDTAVDLYFIIDLVLNCFTAFDNFGIRETRHKQIVVHYLRSWFLFDLIACVPVQYIAMAVQNSTQADSGNNLSIIKALRLVRLSKMLRLTRIKRILAKYEDLMFVQQYQGVAVLAFAIIFASHFLACFWYLIGTNGQDKSYNEFKDAEGFELVDSNYIDGWVTVEWGNVSTEPDTLADIPIQARYTSSMYYVFNALENGSTDAERMFGILSFFVVVMIDGAVAGVLSAMMISMGGADREITCVHALLFSAPSAAAAAFADSTVPFLKHVTFADAGVLCRDKLKQAKGWMKEQRIPHEDALVAMQYLQQSFKSKAVHGRDGKHDHDIV